LNEIAPPRQLNRYAANLLMTKKLDIDILPEHESGVRRMVSDSRSIPYQALQSLDEAKSFSDGTVILEGDDGGQIYVVALASLVRCPVENLNHLLRDLDGIGWPNSDPNSARVFYERLPVGAPVFGGMGGAIVSEDVWIHQMFCDMNLESAIRGVLVGERARIRDAA
jgi:hypothetical protein